MTKLHRAFHTALFLVAAVVGSGPCLAKQQGTSPNTALYFIDCGGKNSAGDGSSAQTPWTSLDQVDGHTFIAGDVLSLRRGSLCQGTLSPKGSGAPSAPIRITAYGTGPRPRIVADPDADSVLKLFNQEYWDIDSLDISGGLVHGIFISGDKGVLHHIHLANLAVHDVAGGEMKQKESGLVIISPGSVDQHFDDVLLDGIVAYNTRQWAGILVGGGNFGFPPESTWSTRVTIRNSIVHDVEGDGIVLFRVRDGRIASSIAWNTGMQVTESMGTPNAIWTWMCHDCTVEDNEAFLTDSPGVDGGAFDIDYGNTNNAVIGNYAHDTQGYCVAIFAAGFVTRKSVVRSNTCIDNARSPRMAQFQGAIFLHTWNNGTLDEVTVENNRIYWDPPGTQPAVINDASFTGSPAVFRSNRIESSSPWMIASNASLRFDNNQYLLHSRDAGLQPRWVFGGRTFNGWQDFRGRSEEERSGSFSLIRNAGADPFLTGQPLPPDGLPASRAQPIPALKALDGNAEVHRPPAGSWTLFAILPASRDSKSAFDEASRHELTLLSSLETQFHPSGLRVVVALCSLGDRPSTGVAFNNSVADAPLDSADFGMLSRDQHCPQQPGTLLLSPQGKLIASWEDTPSVGEIGIIVRRALGKPNYAQMSSAPR